MARDDEVTIEDLLEAGSLFVRWKELESREKAGILTPQERTELSNITKAEMRKLVRATQKANRILTGIEKQLESGNHLAEEMSLWNQGMLALSVMAIGIGLMQLKGWETNGSWVLLVGSFSFVLLFSLHYARKAINWLLAHLGSMRKRGSR